MWEIGERLARLLMGLGLASIIFAFLARVLVASITARR